MSLQVWLPLTKDLRQQGLDNNYLVSTSTATYSSTGGKLGGCYNFSGTTGNGILLSGDVTTFMNTYINNHSWSLCAWVKNSVSDRGTPVISLTYGLRMIAGSVTNISLYNSSRTVNCTSSVATGDGKWHHIVATYNVNTNAIKIYVDGVNTGNATYTSGYTYASSWTNGLYIGRDPNNSTANASYFYQGAMNDVRIYDHCLSPMEVKELAKGLVLHYPLNDKSIESTTNLNTKVNMNNSTNSIWGGHSTTTTTYDCTNEPVPFNSGNKIEITYPVGDNTGGGTSINLGVNIPVTSSTVYTLSVYLKASDNFSYWTANFIYYYGDSSGHGIFNINNKEYIGNGWYRIWGTLTTGSSQTSLNPYFYSYPGGNKTYYIGGWQLEQKDHITPFTSPGTSRSNSIIYDCSGFCNNLNKNGTYAYTSDTPKYAVSTKFNGTEWMNGATPGAEILTLACWAKTSKNKSTSQFMVADSTSQLCISFYSGTIISFFGGSGQSTGSKCTLGSAYKENDWNHFVVVKTGTGTRKVYCNGIEQTATSNDYWGSAAGLFIGSRNNSATLPFYGQICDVRAYATALSADDVKSLYQNSAYIDSFGNVYGAVHTEV